MTAVEAAGAARSTASIVGHAMRAAGALAGWLMRWTGRHWRYVLAGVAVAVAAARLGRPHIEAAAILAVVMPALVATVWARWWPLSYERWVAGPSRRAGWRRWAQGEWPDLARECGLSVQRKRHPWWRLVVTSGREPEETVWVAPRLMDVTTTRNTLTLLIRARRGQTVDDLEKGAAALAASGSAVSWRTRPLTPSVLQVALVMREELDNADLASDPAGVVEVDSVRMGRRQDGTDWRLLLRGRHTLVVGCTGSGKGSMLWGVCGGLAPAVHADLVRLRGVDLKKGVEIGMGRDLFHATATTATDALPLLVRLLEVLNERGHAMAGVARLHRPAPGDPLHVLVIDELADLIAYSEPTIRVEANRLLAEVLTQGRALGVVVLACVQDPRKETVGLRGLYTQTVALRLRSADETRMVLGDGMAALAPAHRLSPAAQGSAWVVEDDGSVDRVRADYWPDPLIRQIADTYRPTLVAGPVDDTTVAEQASAWMTATKKPRTHRAPRPPRLTQASDDLPGGEAA